MEALNYLVEDKRGGLNGGDRRIYFPKKTMKVAEVRRDDGTIRDLFFDFGSVHEYEFLEKISQGSYGVVYRAMEKNTGRIVAIKKEFSGLSKSTITEIFILKNLAGNSRVVEFIQAATDEKKHVFVVMEYLKYSLDSFMKLKKAPFTQFGVREIMKQLLEGVRFLHANGVMHRDLKPSNILLDDCGNIKICDFGLSRTFEKPVGCYSPRVATLWYKAPELLVKEEQYSPAVDMWSVGCIMAELFLKRPVFKGKSEIDQIAKISSLLGTPNYAFLREFKGPAWSQECREEIFSQVFLDATDFEGATILTDKGFDLMNRLLRYDPERRITAEDALRHAWFEETFFFI